MSSVKQKINIRKATKDDGDTLCELINALADYEKKSGLDTNAKKRLKEDAFGSSPRFETWLADISNRSVGYAITMYTYSTFMAMPILYLEDIFILPKYRSLGIGKELFKYVAKVSLENNCWGMKWQVLDWNQLAIDFYEKVDAKQMKEWLPYMMTRDKIERFLKS